MRSDVAPRALRSLALADLEGSEKAKIDGDKKMADSDLNPVRVSRDLDRRPANQMSSGISSSWRR
jgi:hypothetical protein